MGDLEYLARRYSPAMRLPSGKLMIVVLFPLPFVYLSEKPASESEASVRFCNSMSSPTSLASSILYPGLIALIIRLLRGVNVSVGSVNSGSSTGGWVFSTSGSILASSSVLLLDDFGFDDKRIPRETACTNIVSETQIVKLTLKCDRNCFMASG